MQAIYSHLAVNVSDLAASTAFYVEAFGFVPGRPYRAGGRRLATFMDVDPAGFDGVFLRLGDVMVELLAHRAEAPARDAARRATSPGPTHVSFVVTGFDEFVHRVHAAGGSLLSTMEYAFAAGPPTRIAFCLDPDGNRIELVQHPDADEARAHAAFLGADGLGWPAPAAYASGPAA